MSLAVNVRNADKVRTLTFTTPAEAQDANDVLANTQEIEAVALGLGGTVILDSIVLIDEADQKVALHFVFLNANVDLGTEDAAADITDAESAANVIGFVSLAATDYIDLGGTAVATKSNIGLVMQAASTTDSLWVAILNSTGTPTYGATSLTGKFGFRRVEQHT